MIKLKASKETITLEVISFFQREEFLEHRRGRDEGHCEFFGEPGAEDGDDGGRLEIGEVSP